MGSCILNVWFSTTASSYSTTGPTIVQAPHICALNSVQRLEYTLDLPTSVSCLSSFFTNLYTVLEKLSPNNDCARPYIPLDFFRSFLLKHKVWGPYHREPQKIPQFFGHHLYQYTALENLPNSNSTLGEIHGRLILSQCKISA